jgi:3-oxoacyl-[acyl-carrier protein] reductase
MPLRERVAVVTGGSRGIGRAICLALAEQNAAVAVTYRERADAAAEVVQAIESEGGHAVALTVDMADAASVKALFAEVRAQLGPVQILVNAAGVLQDAPLAMLSDANWRHVLDVNLRGAFVV